MAVKQYKSLYNKPLLRRYAGYVASAWNSLKHYCLFCYSNRLIPLAVVALLGALSLFLLPVSMFSCLGLAGVLFLSALYNIKRKLSLQSHYPSIRQELTMINSQLGRYRLTDHQFSVHWAAPVCSIVVLMTFACVRIGSSQNCSNGDSGAAAEFGRVDETQKIAYVSKFSEILAYYNVGDMIKDFIEYVKTCYLQSLVPIRLLFVSMLVVLMGLFSFGLYTAAAISGCLSVFGVASNIVSKLAISVSDSNPPGLATMVRQQIQSSMVMPRNISGLSLIELACVQINLWLLGSSCTTFPRPAIGFGAVMLHHGAGLDGGGASGGCELGGSGSLGLSSGELNDMGQQLKNSYNSLWAEIPRAAWAKISSGFMPSRQPAPVQTRS